MMYPRRVRMHRARHKAVADELPMLTTMIRIAMLSGCNIRNALVVASSFSGGVVANELEFVLSEVDAGVRLSEALDSLIDRTSPEVQNLVSTLQCAERYGSPIGTLLEQLARDAQSDRVHIAEREAKRLSVHMLFPLAGLTLPAFGLLAVFPMLVSVVEALSSVS